MKIVRGKDGRYCASSSPRSDKSFSHLAKKHAMIVILESSSSSSGTG